MSRKTRTEFPSSPRTPSRLAIVFLPLTVGGRRANLLRMRDHIQTRIENLKKDIEEVSGEKPMFGRAPDCPPEVEEAFLRQVLQCELKEKHRRERRAKT